MSEFKIHLFSPNGVIPTWWYQFAGRYRSDHYKKLDEKLAEYNGKFCMDKIPVLNGPDQYGERYLLFKTEADAIMFMLKECRND